MALIKITFLLVILKGKKFHLSFSWSNESKFLKKIYTNLHILKKRLKIIILITFIVKKNSSF